jgi:hypothetical protein
MEKKLEIKIKALDDFEFQTEAVLELLKRLTNSVGKLREISIKES